jgi:hypothetical protein
VIRSFLAVALALASLPAAAQAPAPPVEAFDALVRCRALTDAAERLACFDGAVARLDSAERSGDVVLVDRAQVREARKSAFGFDFDGFKLFDRAASPEAPLKAVELVAAVARRGAAGQWTFVTTNGQVWRQVDKEPLNRGAKAGSRLEIRTAALGSYFMNVDGQRAIRVRREK